MVVSLRSRILFGYIILVAVIGSMAAIRSSTTYMRILNNGIYTNSK